MYLTVSDFKIAESFLRLLCAEKGLEFVDACVIVDDGEERDDNILGIHIQKSENVIETIYLIIEAYIDNARRIFHKDIVDKNNYDKIKLYISLWLRTIIDNDVLSQKEETILKDNLILERLYQRPLVWIMMKDIICPIYEKPLQNIKVVSGCNSYIDISRFYDKGEIKKDNDHNYPFVFVNNISNNVVQNVFLFIETLRSYDLCPIEVVKDIFESPLYEKFFGLLKISLGSEKLANDFVTNLIMLLGIDLFNYFDIRTKSDDILKDAIKIAQISPDGTMQWWFLGVLERMMERNRGTDLTTYNVLEQYRDDFWGKVKKIKDKYGDIPFNYLLKMKRNYDGTNEEESCRVLQSLLSKNRTW